MTRKLEAGPLLVALAALVLLVSLFLDWYAPSVTAWEAFEVWDVVLLAVAVAALAAGLGGAVAGVAALDRRWLAAAGLVALVVVASQLIDPPPAAFGAGREVGAWLALGAAVAMAAGALLAFGRVRLALSVERRDVRRHVAAVDARGPRERTTETGAVPAAKPVSPRPDRAGDRPPDPNQG